MAIYSWMGLPVQVHMTDENAAAYNRVGDALKTIDPKLASTPEKIQFVADPKDVEVWNKVGDIINGMIDLNDGLPYSEEEITTHGNYFVRVADK